MGLAIKTVPRETRLHNKLIIIFLGELTSTLQLIVDRVRREFDKN